MDAIKRASVELMDTTKKQVDELAVLVLKQDNKSIYLIPVSGLLKLTPKRWEQNREEDKGRVEKIRKYQNTKECVNGIISFGYLQDKGLVCYDGNHRRVALTSDISHVKVLISIIWKATDKILEEEFDLINKSVSVPRIYTDKSLESTKVIFINFSRYLEDRYPKFISGSASCKRPNFNRDVLVDDLVSIHQSKRFKHLSAESLIELIKHTNKCYRKEKFKFDSDTLSKNIKEKCEKFGLWLFCEDRTIDRDYLKKCLKEFPLK